jgi:hypothetical protein
MRTEGSFEWPRNNLELKTQNSKLRSRFSILQKRHNPRSHILRGEAVGRNVYIAVLAGVVEAAVLFIEEGLPPAGASSAPDGMQGSVKVDQDVRIGALPQVGNVGVLLRYGVGLEAPLLEGAHQG